jgi:hypothetical protein
MIEPKTYSILAISFFTLLLVSVGMSNAYAEDTPAFLYEFGFEVEADNSADGLFNSPYAITTDSQDNIYVTESGNHRIQKFLSDGTYVTQWGRFSAPLGITADSQDNIYVSDKDKNRIQKFSSDGDFMLEWGSSGTGDGQFTVPHGITTDSQDNVYVVDRGNNRIQVFSSNGTYITQWGTYGTGDGQFDYPHGITTDSQDNVYVADSSNQRIQKFLSDGTYITQWGTYGTGDGQFTNPIGITTDSQDNIYVTEGRYDRLQKFSSDGTYVTHWNSERSSNSQFVFIFGITTDSQDNIYVVVNSNDIVEVFGILSTLDAPTSLDVTAGNSQVTLNWIAPTSHSDSITDYTIQYKLNNATSFSIFDDGVSSNTTATVTGLTNDSLYNFQPSWNSNGFIPVSGITIPNYTKADIDSMDILIGGSWVNHGPSIPANQTSLGDDVYYAYAFNSKHTKNVIFVMIDTADGIFIKPLASTYGSNSDPIQNRSIAKISEASDQKGYGLASVVINFNN